MTIPRRRILLTVVLISCAALIIFGLLVIFAPKPPEGELVLARQNISEAREMKADVYCPELFDRSEEYYDSAMTAWRQENRRFLSTRDYRQAKTYAQKAAEIAEKARKEAASRSVNLKAVLVDRIEALESTIKSIRDLIAFLPLPENVRKENSKGILLFNEACTDYKKKQYQSCQEKIDRAQDYINRSSEFTMNMLTGYFQNQPEWNKLAEAAINTSKKDKNYAIIVDKFDRTCLVYYNGKLKHTFEVELGKNWIGDKRIMGDKSTPEGSYRVIRRLDNGRTKFYKALLLNYPNDDDVRQFNHEKKNGMLSETAEIGGLIEIHGEGGKGTDWTDGCIALNNKDMDILYSITQTGTSVTIVGSLKPLDEIVSLSNQ